MKKILNKKGFTLIELIVVIAILAILALILVPSITGYIEKANDAKNQANARAEYSRVVLEAWTNNGTPYQRNSTTIEIVSGTAYTLTGTGTTAMSCTATFSGTNVSAFECSVGTGTAKKTWSAANDFTP
jgi:prepilin-type N-terminal cleavage/methylation domain-containing protein